MHRGHKVQHPALFVGVFLALAVGAMVLILAGNQKVDTGSGGTPGGSVKATDCPRQDPPAGVKLSDIEGKTVGEAEAWAKDNGFAFRVVQEDGENFAVTADYSTDRVNTQVEAGVVTRYCGNF